MNGSVTSANHPQGPGRKSQYVTQPLGTRIVTPSEVTVAIGCTGPNIAPKAEFFKDLQAGPKGFVSNGS